mgnify:CR=1 FL=1
MIALCVAKLKMFSPESKIFPRLKPKKKKNFFGESLDQYWRLEERKKARNVFFVMSLRLYDHEVLHNIASSSNFLSMPLGFSPFFRSYFVFQILEFEEFSKTIIPFALVGYETGYSQLGATRLLGYLPSHIQRELME